MKSEYNKLSDTQAELVIEAGEDKLNDVKKITLKRLQPEISAPGFRKGKVPLNLVEKHSDENYFKSQFLDDALTELYRQALKSNKLRPLSQPEVEIQKFVPYTDIAFKVKVDVVPPIKLGDYKKIKAKFDSEEVTEDDIVEVIDNLRKRTAEKKEVKRAAEDGDEILLDFKGVDDKDQDVAGATGKDYPLTLGSKSFIDGFEEKVEGMKAGEDKTFTLKFPKDYAHKPLASKKVSFTVNVKTVSEVVLPKADDKFAESVGPFKSMSELKKDVKQQLAKQKEQESSNKLKDNVIEQLVSKSKLEVPDVLVNENIESLFSEFKQNLVYRGITLPEYLEQAGQTEEEYREKDVRPRAELRVKTGLVLAEVSEAEGIQVTPEELEIRMQLLKGQYQNDNQMMSQLDNPEAVNEIASRLVTEKTIDALVEYATN